MIEYISNWTAFDTVFSDRYVRNTMYVTFVSGKIVPEQSNNSFVREEIITEEDHKCFALCY